MARISFEKMGSRAQSSRHDLGRTLPTGKRPNILSYFRGSAAKALGALSENFRKALSYARRRPRTPYSVPLGGIPDNSEGGRSGFKPGFKAGEATGLSSLIAPKVIDLQNGSPLILEQQVSEGGKGWGVVGQTFQSGRTG